MKNGKPHDVQLAELERVILQSVPRVAKRDLVFTTTGKTPISGFSRRKRRSMRWLRQRAKAASEAGRGRKL